MGWNGMHLAGWGVFYGMGRVLWNGTCFMEWNVFMESGVFHGMGFGGVGVGCVYARVVRVGVRRPQEEHLQIVAGEGF